MERLLQRGDLLLGQELTDALGIVNWCVVMVKQPQDPPLRALSEAEAAGPLSENAA